MDGGDLHKKIFVHQCNIPMKHRGMYVRAGREYFEDEICRVTRAVRLSLLLVTLILKRKSHFADASAKIGILSRCLFFEASKSKLLLYLDRTFFLLPRVRPRFLP